MNSKSSLWGQLGLLLGVGLILLSLTVTLSPQALDAFLLLNFAGTLLVLIVSLLVTQATQLASFPSLLLFLTLFRLSLNIASTRLILGQGEGGFVISKLGSVVTQGNLGVGFVTFFVMLIVNYIVVAKGSERVAEVAARFFLDALPGKQMSIDADLRAGLLTPEQAAELRANLEGESRFFGAMDGALKFIKGDALAGFLILAVNFLGGLLMGTLQKGWTLSRALQQYTLLTLGDGVVAQIPSLILSLTAGFLVTRGSSLESLGGKMGRELLGYPRAWMAVGLLFLIVPWGMGLSRSFFLLYGGLFFSVGLMGETHHRSRRQKESCFDKLPETSVKTEPIGLVCPWSLEMSPKTLMRMQQSPHWLQFFKATLPECQRRFSEDQGVVVPCLEVCSSPRVSDGFYRFMIYGIEVGRGEFVFSSTASVSPSEYSPSHDDKKALVRVMMGCLTHNVPDFVGLQQVKQLLDSVQSLYPDLVHDTVPRRVSLQKLASLSKRLVEESIPLSDFRLVLESLSDCMAEELGIYQLTETVRRRLSKVISQKFSRQGKLRCFLVDSTVESHIKKLCHEEQGELFLKVSSQKRQSLLKTFDRYIHLSSAKVILVEGEIRRALFVLIHQSHPDLKVLAFEELEPGVTIAPEATISISGLSSSVSLPRLKSGTGTGL